MIPDDLFEVIKSQQLTMLAMQRQLIELAVATKKMDDEEFLAKIQESIKGMEAVKAILTGQNINE